MINPDNQPTTTGVYVFKKGNAVLYIGKSVNIRARLRSHIENAKVDVKESLIVNGADSIESHITDSEFKALILEAHFIQKYHPKYNVIWKDNKSYLYIKVTLSETYPKIFLVRKPREVSIKKDAYFGPFSSVRTVSLLIGEIRKLIPFCTQKSTSKKPCFYSKIGLCNPCPNRIENGESSMENKIKLKKVYLNNIHTVIRILDGNVNTVLRKFYLKLKLLTKERKYEEAIIVRNKIFRFEQLLYSKSLPDEKVSQYNQSKEALKSLLKLLNAYYPSLDSLSKIECYDVSNISQKMGTASMVVLKNGLIEKSEYKKFKIKNLKLRSDFEMMEEVLRRRFAHNWKLPNLLVIDGGKPQLRVALKVLKVFNSKIPVVGLAKNPDRLVIGISNLPTVRFLKGNKGFNLLRMLRDESHRFARKYHLFLRDRNFLLSPFTFKKRDNT